MTHPLRPITDNERTAFHRDGAVVLKDVLAQEWLTVVAEGLEEAHTAPDGMSSELPGRLRIDQFPAYKSAGLGRMVSASPIAAIVGSMLGKPIRFYMDQMFYKPAGFIPPTDWHQDTCYYNIEGNDVIRAWVSPDPVPRDISIEVVRGSHLWNITYGTVAGHDPSADPHGAAQAQARFAEQKPILGRDAFENWSYMDGFFDSSLPLPPDINGNRDSFDILGWDYTPGDVLLFHGNILHGAAGGATSPTPRRAHATLWAGPDVRYIHRRGQVLPDPIKLYDHEPMTGQSLSEFEDVFPLAWAPQQN